MSTTINSEDLKNTAADNEQSKAFAMKMVEELRKNLVDAFVRIASEYNTSPEKIQLAIRFEDLPTGEGRMFYQVMQNWTPARVANFNRDILGVQGKAAMFPDESGKEAFLQLYILGNPVLKVEGIFHALANKHGITKWSDISGIFYRINPDDQIKLGIFLPIDGKNKKVETINIFDNDIPEQGLANTSEDNNAVSPPAG